MKPFISTICPAPYESAFFSTRVALRLAIPSGNPDTSTTFPTERVSKVTFSNTVPVRSTMIETPSTVMSFASPFALTSIAVIGPSTSSSKITVSAIPVTPSGFTVPSTSTTIPTPRSSSVASSPSMMMVAFDVSNSTPLTKIDPKPSIVPIATGKPDPLIPDVTLPAGIPTRTPPTLLTRAPNRLPGADSACTAVNASAATIGRTLNWLLSISRTSLFIAVKINTYCRVMPVFISGLFAR